MCEVPRTSRKEKEARRTIAALFFGKEKRWRKRKCSAIEDGTKGKWVDTRKSKALCAPETEWFPSEGKTVGFTLIASVAQ